MNALSNADVAKVLLGVAQLLGTEKGNAFKIKAYRRAARTIATLGDSIEALVKTGADLTEIPGIGEGIAGTIREVVQRGGSLRKLDELRAKAGEHAADLSEYALLDPARVKRIYQKLGISSVDELRDRLERGDIGKTFGAHMERHVQQALNPATEMRLIDADRLAASVKDYVLSRSKGIRIAEAGDYRRRVEVVGKLCFVIEAESFARVVKHFQRFTGGAALVRSDDHAADFRLGSGIGITLHAASPERWGLSLLVATGTAAHIKELVKIGLNRQKGADEGEYQTEEGVYGALGLDFIPPELREGRDEIMLARSRRLPALITPSDIRGELHAHTTASDGSQTIEQMAEEAKRRGYEFLGITDHSQSLTIAHGLPEAELWEQIKKIDKLNASGDLGVRLLKSAEVDILADGSLDYPDSLLRELDYTVCSIHSKFNLSKREQTERIMRAMDNRYFNILGHATGRRLLKRPGYDIHLDRIVEHARKSGCFIEINSNPERLDVSAENARVVSESGVMIAINTDAHSIREFEFLRYGIDQARRAGLSKKQVLNCLPWSRLKRLFKR